MNEFELLESESRLLNQKRKKIWPFVILAIMIFGFVFIISKPGVYSIPPIGMLPEGTTFIYYGRNPDLPFFSSPDAMCIRATGDITLLCRGLAIGESEPLVDRIMFKLDYSPLAYQLSVTWAMELYEADRAVFESVEEKLQEIYGEDFEFTD